MHERLGNTQLHPAENSDIFNEAANNQETVEDVTVREYSEARSATQRELAEALARREETMRLSEARASLGLAVEQSGDIAREDERIRELEGAVIRAQSDYPGHWTLLLADRLRDPSTREKFIRTRTEALDSLREGTPSMLDKKKQFRSHYEDQLAKYDENIDAVFSLTGFGPAREQGKQPTSLGVGTIGERGTVFSDAEHANHSGLTVRQKAIIEAHEKGHGIRDFQGSDAQEIREVLDVRTLKAREEAEVARGKERFANYLSTPEEIIERMAQLKNYFGFAGNETFTKDHLRYAREHYIQDTGLDNSMTEFFAAITPDSEEGFLEVMNSYPI